MSVKVAGGASNALAEVKAASALALATDAALVVMNRPDDPTFAPTFVTGAGGQLAINSNILLAVGGAGSYDTGNSRSFSIEIIPAAGTVTAGTIVFEGSNDDANWVAVTLYDRASPANTPVSTYAIVASTPRYFSGDVIWRKMRVRLSVGVTGTTTGVQCFAYWSQQDYTPSIFMVRPSDGTNVGPTMDAAARRGYVQVTDGTNSMTVKAASTPAAAADLGAVVSLSPNLPVPSATFLNSAASTNATSVKATAGRITSLVLTNVTGTVCFFKLYNKASAPTVGTDIPIATIAVPATGVPVTVPLSDLGLYFSTGIAFAITNLVADADTTVVAIGSCKVALNYI